MYSEWVGPAIGGLFIWLLILSFLIWRSYGFLSGIFNELPDRDLKKKLKDLLNLKVTVDELEKTGKTHLQRIGFVRYNPFEDTGGDQSYSLAILDDWGNGVVLSSLHGRSESRTFAKPVKSGKPEKYQFSKEEEEAVKRALKD